ncbi:hypothetical protein [Halorubrum ezzemoulense]|uniref:Uncharacterized protein n=1 Tax=Halorubrum ezzemoulense TaxID=337243 RepID=A0A256JWM3_HALEZ|nr:hypothetical protein [Halorubrum ezzemoulense]OYR73191.1 hypothetical protein DJ76_10340 [Halorubrum ezzemoulense]
MSVQHTEAGTKGLTTKADRGGERLETANATVRLESGPAGTVARIDHDHRERVEYAGPLSAATVDALRRVANGGDAR